MTQDQREELLAIASKLRQFDIDLIGSRIQDVIAEIEAFAAGRPTRAQMTCEEWLDYGRRMIEHRRSLEIGWASPPSGAVGSSPGS